MNIIDSIGVLLGGESRGFDQMMDNADKRLEAFDQKATAWGAKMSLYVGAPLLALGIKSVWAFASQEKAIVGLQSQIDKADAEPLIKFADDVQDALGKDNTAIIQLMTRFAQMGVAANKLKQTTTNVLGFSEETGMGEFQAFRSLQMLKYGQTMMMARYVPGIAQMSKEQQIEKVNELINRGLKKIKDEATTTAGAFKLMKLMAGDVDKEVGNILNKVLHLPAVFQRMAGYYRGLKAEILKMSEGTQRWVVGIGLALALVGPVTLVFTKLFNIMASLAGAAFKFGKALFTSVLPAVLFVLAAFMGYEIMKTLGQWKVGLLTISQWTELAVVKMMGTWDKYFGYIRAGINAVNVSRDLAKAYGMKPGESVGNETRGAKKERLAFLEEQLRKVEMREANGDFAKLDAAGQFNASKTTKRFYDQIDTLKKEIAAMGSNPDNNQISGLEKQFKLAQSTSRDWFKPGGTGDALDKSMEASFQKMILKHGKDMGINDPKDFFANLKHNIETDGIQAFRTVMNFFEKAFPRFVPPELKGDAAGTGLSPDDMVGKRKRNDFAGALVEGTQAAYSAMFGNGSSQADALLNVSERSAKSNEKTSAILEKWYQQRNYTDTPDGVLSTGFA